MRDWDREDVSVADTVRVGEPLGVRVPLLVCERVADCVLVSVSDGERVPEGVTVVVRVTL